MPCNQFGAQEPGSEAEILEFVQSKYDVDFPMFAKIEVNGDGACELYRLLKAAKPGDIGWNFTKFLVDGSGNVVERFEPQVTPEEIEPRVKELLG
jgi:glutathione peroxidase